MKSKCLVLLFLLSLCLSVQAQPPIKRKGATVKKPKATTTAPVRKKNVASRPARRTYHNDYDYYDVDTVAVDTAAVETDEGLIETEMVDGFALCGRMRTDYEDNAEAQKELAASIKNYTNAKVGCLTDHKGIFVYGGNGYHSNALSSDMTEALSYCNKNKFTINDVTMTDIGWWCVVYEGNKYKGNIPEACKKTLDDYISQGDKILSVSISENGDYAFITDKHYEASNEFDKKAMSIAAENYGFMKCVCITNAGIMVTCNDGIFFWNVPQNVIEYLQKQNGKPTTVRYTDSGTYIALDGKGFKAWYM